MVTRVYQVILELKEFLVTVVSQDIQEPKERLDTQVFQVSVGYRDILGSMEIPVTLESQVQVDILGKEE